jgi:hypothetical protein
MTLLGSSCVDLSIWVATRDGSTGAFGKPRNVGELNSAADESGAFLAPDGTTLYYNYDMDIGGGRDSDAWVAHRSCL